MTEEFFGFAHRPFRCTPDSADYVSLACIEQEIDRLIAAAVQGDGVCVLTAPPGAGKTVVCERLRNELAGEFKTAVLSSSAFATRRALLQGVLFALGQPYEDFSEQESRLGVLNFGRSVVAHQEGIVLIVDEAHLLNARLLEELRCLTNHSEGGRPLIRVILCGQLALEDALIDPALQALNYRITCHATLEPLTMQESAAFIAGRLLNAGRAVEAIFTPNALETICRVSDGNPRCLVQLSDQALCVGAARGESPVSVESVRLALHDLKQLPLHWNESAMDRPSIATDDVPCNEITAGADTSLEIPDSPMFEQKETPSISAWSAAVSSVEVGSEIAGASEDDPEFQVTGEVEEMDSSLGTEGWSSFESGSMAEDLATNPATRNSVSDIESTDLPSGTEDFREIAVDDEYAVLDRTAARTSRLCESTELVDLLHSSVSTCRRHRDDVTRHVAPSATSDHTPGSAKRPTDELPPAAQALRQPSANPEQRIDEILVALSLANDVSAEASDPGTSSDEPHSRIAWQSAGDSCRFDLVEPFGAPTWDEEPVLEEVPAPLEPSIERPVLVEEGSLSSKLADPGDMHRHDTAHADGHRYSASAARPYARLFSRLRRQRA